MRRKSLTLPNTPTIRGALDFVARLRNDRATRDLSFGRWATSVPISHIKALANKFPGLWPLSHPDHQTAYRKFLNSPDSKPYRLR